MNNPVVVPANRKGGHVLLYDEHRYVRNKKTKLNLLWRCTHTGCNAYLKTNLFDVTDKDAVILGNFSFNYFLISCRASK
jgi:FLYWCH zinc finger domain